MPININKGTNHLCLGIWINDAQKGMLCTERIPNAVESVRKLIM